MSVGPAGRQRKESVFGNETQQTTILHIAPLIIRQFSVDLLSTEEIVPMKTVELIELWRNGDIVSSFRFIKILLAPKTLFHSPSPYLIGGRNLMRNKYQK